MIAQQTTPFLFDKAKKTIIIPEGVQYIPSEAFMDITWVEEIKIPSSVTKIGTASFKGCNSLKKIELPNNLQVLESFAFSECKSLEEITIPTSLHYISHGLFSHCYNLKTVNMHDKINYIDDFAFFECKKLTHFSIPSSVTSIGKMSFMSCESLKQIYIHDGVTDIGLAAFALMSSLEQIIVHPKNKKYVSNEDNTILFTTDGVLLQYAIQSKKEELNVHMFIKRYTKYPKNDMELSDLITIYNIADYAFAGAKNLKKLSISSETESIGAKTFSRCEQLKDLEIIYTVSGKVFTLHITNSICKDVEIPFENIIVGEGIGILCENSSELFKNAKTVLLPNTLNCIGENVFSKSKNLKELKLPPSIRTIYPKTFFDDMILHFTYFGTIKAKNFGMLQTRTNHALLDQNRGSIQIFSLAYGSYLVRINDFDIVKIREDEIASCSLKQTNKLEEPILHLIHLLNNNETFSNMLIKAFQNPELKSLFSKFDADSDYVISLAEKKLLASIRTSLKNHGIFNKFFICEILIRIFGKDDFAKIIKNYNLSIERFIKFGVLKEDMPISADSFIQYCNLLEKYHQYDQFLYNPVFFHNVSIKNQELLIRYLNKNLKHLLRNSETLDDLYGENLNDLLNLCNILGIFSDDKIISQKMCMLLTEKIINKDCSYSIIQNKIHTIFSGIYPKEKLDYGFIRFFTINYQKLLEIEKEYSGIIVRIYHAFEEILKVSTSNKGSGRQLMVTVLKCLEFFQIKHFSNISENDIELANLLQKYYSDDSVFEIAKTILMQSENAPRNIFTKVRMDQNGKPIYSHSELEDLEEQHENFSYHWLPKQNYDNFLLGKYCNCCAHLLGDGAGIMRASMILDNCQNLVIKNKNREIIAKMTIYVNKEQGYAVFNTAEVNVNYHEPSLLKEICEAFMRGVYAFVWQYNKNNKIPISTVTIGEYRNELKNYLGNIYPTLLPTPNYSAYGYQINQKFIGKYNGDSKEKQILLLKK